MEHRVVAGVRWIERTVPIVGHIGHATTIKVLQEKWLDGYDEPYWKDVLTVKETANELKDLAEHNSEASSTQTSMMNNKSVLNGIACPECGEELYDSNPMVTLTSMPAKKNVHCSNERCGHVGYRIA